MQEPNPILSSQPQPFSILPQHRALDDHNAHSNPPRPSSQQFLHTILTQTHAFLAEIPRTFRADRKARSSPPARAPVQLSTRTHPHKEFWACRTSLHQNAPVDGSASWEEFRSGLRENHAENEMAYTPSVTAVETLLTWPVEAEVEGGWRDVEMQVNMITHTFHPTALIAPRSFVVLAISADRPNNAFVTIQIPLASQNQASGSVPKPLHDQIVGAAPRNAIFASYTSVEQVVLQAESDQIEWTMATTSDAGGAIPQWVQRSWALGGVPRAIVADVGLFLRWTSQRRNRS